MVPILEAEWQEFQRKVFPDATPQQLAVTRMVFWSGGYVIFTRIAALLDDRPKSEAHAELNKLAAEFTEWREQLPDVKEVIR